MEKRSPEALNGSQLKNGHKVSFQHQLQTSSWCKKEGTYGAPCSSDFSISPSSGATHRLPLLWDAAKGEPAFLVFSSQHGLPCNLPSDELSLSGALKALLANADFVCIPILMLQWNGMKNGFFAGNRKLCFGAKSTVTNVSVRKPYFFLCGLCVYFPSAASYKKCLKL